jgi:hypothetical protein
VQALLAFSLMEDHEHRFAEATALAEEALELARARNDLGAQGWVLQFLGGTRWRAGDTVGAKATLAEALAVFRRSGGVWGEADNQTILAMIERTEGALTRAVQLHADALRLRCEAGELVGVYNDIVGLATSLENEVTTRSQPGS